MSSSKDEQHQMLSRLQRGFGEAAGDKRSCLLSLDGGGVRGLSSLRILQKIMVKLNAERQKAGQDAVKPCQVFDLIGGSSTGGLITILLGRLEMSIEDCISLYKSIMGSVFGQKEHFFKVKLTNGKMQNTFSQEPLRQAILTVLRSLRIPEDQLYDDGQERACRTFVVARRFESKSAVQIRDYTVSGDTNTDKLTIVEAALATSAASGLFPPVQSREGKTYVDGGLGSNNPTPFVWQLAQDIWANSDGQILGQINTFVSIGTGKPDFTGIKVSAYGFLRQTLVDIVSDTEQTEKLFAKDHRFLIPENGEQKYFRYNVEKGLEQVEVEEHEKVALIEVATDEYLDDNQQRKFELNRCSARLAAKQLDKQRPNLSRQIQSTPVFVEDEVLLQCNECIKTLLRPDIERISEDLNWHRRREQNIKSANPGSLEWLWDTGTSLSKWMEAKKGIFWIYGKEGSGKSVAMKHFFREYQKRNRKEFAIGFFFNKLGSAFEKSYEGLLRATLARILRHYPALFKCIQDHYHEHLDFIPRMDDSETMYANWTRGCLEHAMELIIKSSHYEADFVLFIDAINECDDMEADTLIQLFRDYSEAHSTINFKICFSSTNDVELEGRYSRKLPSLVIQDKTEDDLALYVSTCFGQGLSNAQFDETDLTQILANVLEKAEGCWLWVEYAVSAVNNRSSTIGSVKRSLQELPKEMKALYETSLTKVDQQHAEEANTVLGVVLAMTTVCDAPHIFIDDFRYILGFCLEDQYESQAAVEGHDDFMKTNSILRSRIQEHFGHLLVVQDIGDDEDEDEKSDGKSKDRNGAVQFYHSTVKDFLCNRQTPGQSLILSGEDLQRKGLETFTKACLRFMQCREATSLMQNLASRGAEYFKKTEDAASIFSRLPMLHFTLAYFLPASCHAIQSSTANCEDLKAYWTIQDSELFFSTVNHLMGKDTLDADINLTVVCILEDCDLIVRHQIDHLAVDPNELLPKYGSYLCVAAAFGAVNIVRMLLDLDPPADLDYVSSTGSPLSIAAAKGHKEVVRLLLDKGADPDTPDSLYGDPIAAAAISLNFDIVRLLWEHPSQTGNQRHSKAKSSRALLMIGMALRNASQAGKVEALSAKKREASEVIQSLAVNGLDKSIFLNTSIPILLWSLCVGSTQIMDLMLQDPTILLFKSASDQSLLHVVCAVGPLDMVKLIVKKFEELEHSIDERDKRQCSILHYAALNSDPGVMEYLLSLSEPRLDPNAEDRYGITPLHAAIATGHPKLVPMLLQAGSRMDQEGPELLTMLHLAASNYHHPEVLEFLQEQPINVIDEWGRTPLHIACQFGNTTIVRWLLDRNLDVSTPDERGRTALHCACQNQAPSSAGIIDMLLEAGASVTAVDSEDSTPLHLVFHDPEHVSTSFFWSAYTANYWDTFVERECVRKAQCILAVPHAERFINLQDSEGNTPFHLACLKGLTQVILSLLNLDALLDLPDKRGFLPYQLVQNLDLREEMELVTDWVVSSRQRDFGKWSLA